MAKPPAPNPRKVRCAAIQCTFPYFHHQPYRRAGGIQMTAFFVPDKLKAMPREISAGGVVVRHAPAGWEVAVIEPQREGGSSNSAKRKTAAQGQVLALPKGIVDAGEKADETALREVFEETGIRASILTKLTDIKYVYVRSWGDKQRVFKIVSFYLLRYDSGEIDEVTPEMRIEVKRALWIPLAGAERKLSYRGERDVIRLAQKYLQAHAEEEKSLTPKDSSSRT